MDYSPKDDGILSGMKSSGNTDERLVIGRIGRPLILIRFQDETNGPVHLRFASQPPI